MTDSANTVRKPFVVRIPIIFGWLHFHRKEQWLTCRKPLIVCHWHRANWQTCETVEKRLFFICPHIGEDFSGHSEF